MRFAVEHAPHPKVAEATKKTRGKKHSWRHPSPPPLRPLRHNGEEHSRQSPGAVRSEYRQKLRVVSVLLANGAAKFRIKAVLEEKFGIKRKQQVESLIAAVYKEWREHDTAAAEHQRSAQIRRLQGHIAAARDAGSFAAVIAAERLLADILGTLEPIRVEVKADVVVQQSIEHVLTTLPADAIRQLANQQRELTAGSGLALPAPKQVIEVPAEIADCSPENAL